MAKEIQNPRLRKGKSKTLYKENKASLGNKSLADSRQRILTFLSTKEAEKELDALCASAKVEVNETMLRSIVPHEWDLGDPKGSDQAHRAAAVSSTCSTAGRNQCAIIAADSIEAQEVDCDKTSRARLQIPASASAHIGAERARTFRGDFLSIRIGIGNFDARRETEFGQLGHPIAKGKSLLEIEPRIPAVPKGKVVRRVVKQGAESGTRSSDFRRTVVVAPRCEGGRSRRGRASH